MIVEANGTPETARHALELALSEHRAAESRMGSLTGAVVVLGLLCAALIVGGMALNSEWVLVSSGVPLVLAAVVALVRAFLPQPVPWEARKIEALQGLADTLGTKPRPSRVQLSADPRRYEVGVSQTPVTTGALEGTRYAWSHPWLDLEVHEHGGACTWLRAEVHCERIVETTFERKTGDYKLVTLEKKAVQWRTDRGHETVRLEWSPGRTQTLDAQTPRRWQDALAQLDLELMDVRIEEDRLVAELKSDVFMVRFGGEHGDVKSFGEESLLDRTRLAHLVAATREALAPSGVVAA